MSHASTGLAILILGLSAGCYRDATVPDGVPVIVRLADGSLPLAELDLDRVEVYVTEVAASTTADTLPEDQGWRVIATPLQRFDLAAIRPGAAALVAQGGLPPGTYRALRITIDTDSSRVWLEGGTDARVRWPVDGEYEIHSVVEEPLTVPDGGGLELVIAFQVAQSLSPNVDPLFDFAFFPVVRAVDAQATGAVAGLVLADDDGDGLAAPLANASVTIYRGDPLETVSSWRAVTTARSDALGSYRIGFLLAGSYIVRVEAPFELPPVALPDLLITAGNERRLDVTLAP
ncbi:MAG TPA: DUF4382 domain-containing protein [Gemmatimonadales bacterium]|nr:DUF4382 domain-containing protein [Gemmatimonadales bacterium]